MPLTSCDVQIVGSSLAGLAAAARLARWNHHVVLISPTPLGGRAAPLDHGDLANDQTRVDLLPVVTALPAAWRDLATKTGQPMAGWLNGAHLRLEEAPVATHVLTDGTVLELPADRGGQVQSLTEALGRQHALAWAGLLDDCDTLWQAVRHAGVESPLRADADLSGLRPKLSMGDLAQRLPGSLRPLFCSAAARAGASDPFTAPAFLASRWSVERTFGRWQLVDADTGLVQPMSRLTELLVERVRALGVTIVDLEQAESGVDVESRLVIDAMAPEPTRPRWPRRRTVTAAAPPLVEVTEGPPAEEPYPATAEQVEHHPDGRPTIAWLNHTAHGQVRIVHDHTQPQEPDLDFGWQITTFQSWLDRPALRRSPEVWAASAASHAGNESWAELLTGAQAAYQVHEALTGDDIRPTNKQAPRPPRRQ